MNIMGYGITIVWTLQTDVVLFLSFFLQDTLPGPDTGLEDTVLLPLYFRLSFPQKTHQEGGEIFPDQRERRAGVPEERGERLRAL